MSVSVAPLSPTIVASCARCGLPHAAVSPCPVASKLTLRAAHADLARDTVLAGRFKIEGIAHRSDLSTVYRALDLQRANSLVAVKQISVQDLPADEQATARAWLAREAGLLSSLRNQHLPQLIAAFSEGDEHFVVMPFLAGETLKQRVERDGPMAEEEAARLASTLAYVLSYLHEQDPPIIHRDLKPANILLCDPPMAGAVYAEASVVLLDLGVARPVVAGPIGTAIGTPGYAPPEQYQGLADERSDLYALGATMHYMLTGYEAGQEAPFRHPPVRKLRPEVSAALARMVTALLRLPSHLRPQSALLVGKYLATSGVGEARAARLDQYARNIRQTLCLAAAGLTLTSVLTICARQHLLGLNPSDQSMFFMYLIVCFNGWSTARALSTWCRRYQSDRQAREARRQAIVDAYRGMYWVIIAIGVLSLFAALLGDAGWLISWLGPPALCLFAAGVSFMRLRSLNKAARIDMDGLRLELGPYDNADGEPVFL